MSSNRPDPFSVRSTIQLGSDRATVFNLPALERQGVGKLDRLPFSIRVLLENALRFAGRGIVTEAHVRHLATWSPSGAAKSEIPFMPARVGLQDFTSRPSAGALAPRRRAVP